MALKLKSFADIIESRKLIDIGLDDVFDPEIDVRYNEDGLLKATEYFVAPYKGKRTLWIRQPSGKEWPWKELPDDVEIPQYALKKRQH
jgi:hypothetical protein